MNITLTVVVAVIVILITALVVIEIFGGPIREPCEPATHFICERQTIEQINFSEWRCRQANYLGSDCTEVNEMLPANIYCEDENPEECIGRYIEIVKVKAMD